MIKRFAYRTAVLMAIGVAGLTARSDEAAACSPDDWIGTVCVTAANFCPRGTVDLYGQLMAISENTALFSLISDVYGGDARTTMGMPDLRGRVPVSQGQGSGLTFIQQGWKRGGETVTLDLEELPEHNHVATFEQVGDREFDATMSVMNAMPNQPQATAGSALSYKPIISGGLGFAFYTSTETSPVQINGPTLGLTPVEGSVSTTGAGGSLPVTTIAPQQAARYCLVTDGGYPPRPN